jgi:hypothetical protein
MMFSMFRGPMQLVKWKSRRNCFICPMSRSTCTRACDTPRLCSRSSAENWHKHEDSWPNATYLLNALQLPERLRDLQASADVADTEALQCRH